MISRKIEGMDKFVPKQGTQALVTPVEDLAELTQTINSVRTTLVPFVTSSKKVKIVAETSFEICIKGIKESLESILKYFKDLETEFSIYTWKTQKVIVYRFDFLLRQRLDQFQTLFNVEEGAKPTKTNKNIINAQILDPEGKDMWLKSFGETLMVPWNVFISTFEAYLGIPLKDDLDVLKQYLDFTKIDHVTAYEFGVFMKWFGPLKGCISRLTDPAYGGYLGGFIPAVEANLLLENKKDGTYLVRCSKTQPGSFAVTFVDSSHRVKHCLLHSSLPSGLTLKNPPTVFASLKEFAESHTNKLKIPLGNSFTKGKGFQFDQEAAAAPGPANPAAPASGGRELSADALCIVCMDAVKNTVFLECGHLACCTTCSDKLKLCPVCRNQITRVVPIFQA